MSTLSIKFTGNRSGAPDPGEHVVALTRHEVAPLQDYLSKVDGSTPQLYRHVPEAHRIVQEKAQAAAAAAARTTRQVQWRQATTGELAALAAKQAGDALQASTQIQMDDDGKTLRIDLAQGAVERAHTTRV